MSEPTRLYWNPTDKWVDEMTREELLNVVNEMAAYHKQQMVNLQKRSEILAMIRSGT